MGGSLTCRTCAPCLGQVPHQRPPLLPEALTPAPALGPVCTRSTPVLHSTVPYDAAPPQETPQRRRGSSPPCSPEGQGSVPKQPSTVHTRPSAPCPGQRGHSHRASRLGVPEPALPRPGLSCWPKVEMKGGGQHSGYSTWTRGLDLALPPQPACRPQSLCWVMGIL